MRNGFNLCLVVVSLVTNSVFSLPSAAGTAQSASAQVQSDSYQAFADTVNSGASIWFGSAAPTTRVQMVRVSQLLKDPNLYASDAAALAAIFRYLRSEKMSETDLGSILADRSGLPREYRITRDIVQRGMALYGTHQGPVMDSIDQGQLRDCHLIPSIAAVIERDPNRIKSMIKSGSSPNEYIVSFPGGQNSVDLRMTPGMVAALPNGASDDGLWLPLIILADSVMRNSGVLPNSLYSDMATGTTAGDLRLLTGREYVDRASAQLRAKELWTIMVAAEKAKSPIVIHTSTGDLCISKFAPQSSTVTLQNPWRIALKHKFDSSVTTHGRCSMPFKQFTGTFVGIVYPEKL